MIYFDNSSTTRKKPQEVIDAFLEYVNDYGVSAGRGGYKLGIEASRCLFKTRKRISSYFGLSNNNTVFTKNSTEAINMFVNGFLHIGDHVLITCYEHNAVLRPINHLKERGIIEYSVISRDDLDLPPSTIVSKYCKQNTKLFISTLASNVTGRIVFKSELMKEMKANGITTFLDSSQGAGKIKIDMYEDCVDYLAFTGHKDLLALPGVGGLCSVEELVFDPFIQGGTGVNGHQYSNPSIYPEGYEAGTLNMPAIWSLNAAIEYLNNNSEDINKKENALFSYFKDKLLTVNNIELYDISSKQIPVVGFNLLNKSSDAIVKYLSDNDVCVRGGIHCSILTHESLGTTKSGIVRASINYNNTINEIDEFIDILGRII